jgi:hypothetical protein
MRYTIFIIFLLLFAACDRQIIIDLGKPPRRIALSATLDVDSFVKVHVNRSVSSLDNFGPVPITKANVYLYEDNILVDTLLHGYAGYYQFNIKPQTGKTYTIGCTYEQYDSVYASTTLPNAVPISEATIDTNAFSSNEGSKINIKLTFSDPGSESNYYFIKLYYIDDLNDYYYPVSMTSQDPLFNDVNDYIFDDLTFNGKTRTFTFSIDKPNFQYQPIENFVLELQSLNYDAYQFMKTYERYLNNYDNPFAEPIPVYSNVSSKMGQVSARAISRKALTP